MKTVASPGKWTSQNASQASTAASTSASFPDGTYAGNYDKFKLQAMHYALLTEFDQEWTRGSPFFIAEYFSSGLSTLLNF